MSNRAVISFMLVVGLLVPLAAPVSAQPAPPPDPSAEALPAQLGCVGWPTEQWPAGPLPDGVDPAALVAVGDQGVGPNGGDSLVVIHGGQLVYERYAQGITAETIQPSFSMAKSFASTVVGLLVDEGRLSLDERAPIPEWSATDDPRNAITLRHLLHMSSGLDFDQSPPDYSDLFGMITSPDNAAYVVAKPLAAEPGSRFYYSNGDTVVLSRVIGDTAGVSGDSSRAYLHDQLFDPLGIDPVDPGFDAAGTWLADRQTNTTTRNFAKLGLLYLRDGVWEDEPFLSSTWVDFVRTPSPAFAGYGGQFWLDGDGSFRMSGLGGQAVHIVPELDLIVAVNNGGNTREVVDVFRDAAPASCPLPDACPTDRLAPGTFADIDPGSIHWRAVVCAAGWGIVEGRPDGTFGPQEAVRRDQAASYLARAAAGLGAELPPGGDAFADDDNSVHEPSIDRLAAAGITEGRADGTFEPAATMTRGQMATFLQRLAAEAGVELVAGPNAFADDEGSVHAPAIDALHAAEVITGRLDGTYGPGDQVSRAQLASSLMRLVDLGVAQGLAEPPG